MADDQTQRPYRTNEAPTRGGPAAKVAGNASGSDPLAELARLIGQNDPFSEYGRESARRAAPQAQQNEPASNWTPAAAHSQPAPAQGGHDYYAAPPAATPVSAAPGYAAPTFGRQPFGSAPLAGTGDLYQVGDDAHHHADAHDGHDHEHDNAVYAQLAPQDSEYFEEGPGHRRRLGIMAIAGVFALAVIGTAGAFGYRALFGSAPSNAPPPVIKADTAPSKIVPTAGKDSQSGKLITDRVNDQSATEKLVSREETPVPIRDKPVNTAFPQGQDAVNASAPPQLGSGIVGSEPKRIRTIAIHPDQTQTADATSAAPPQAVPPPAPVQAQPPAPARPAAALPPRPVDPPQASAEPPAPRQPAARPAQPTRVAAAPHASNAPLSLSPDAPPAQPARPARAAPAQPTRVASAPASGGGYAVQVSSQRSEAEAQAAFRALQGKYPSQLGGKQVAIRKVDLGAKGTYYRALVPVGSSSDAAALCSSLKAAGGQCIIQRN